MQYASNGIESKKDFDDNFKIIISTINIINSYTALPFTVFKASSLGKFNLLEKKVMTLLYLNQKNNNEIRVLIELTPAVNTLPI